MRIRSQNNSLFKTVLLQVYPWQAGVHLKLIYSRHNIAIIDNLTKQLDREVANTDGADLP